MKTKNLIFAAILIFSLAFVSCKPEPELETKTYLVDFEDVDLGEKSFWNGSDGSGKFVSGGFEFLNTFTEWDGGFTSWDGFSCSALSDTVTADFTNEFSVIVGKGYFSSKQYGVVYKPFDRDLYLEIPKNEYGFFKAENLMMANSTWAYHFMKKGDSSNTPFGENDYYKIGIEGYKNNVQTAVVTHFLADFTNGKSYISKTWEKVDISSLGEVDKIIFSFESSNVWTPAYFCIDNILFTQEIEE